jgi:hypothetical protein
MPMPPQRDHRISRAEAAAMTRRFRDADGPRAERGGMFPRAAVQALLAQKGCEGLRYYFGRRDDSSSAMILVGVDADGNDMTSGEILEWSYPCPPFCGDPDDLNP